MWIAGSRKISGNGVVSGVLVSALLTFGAAPAVAKPIPPAIPVETPAGLTPEAQAASEVPKDADLFEKMPSSWVDGKVLDPVHPEVIESVGNTVVWVRPNADGSRSLVRYRSGETMVLNPKLPGKVDSMTPGSDSNGKPLVTMWVHLTTKKSRYFQYYLNQPSTGKDLTSKLPPGYFHNLRRGRISYMDDVKINKRWYLAIFSKAFESKARAKLVWKHRERICSGYPDGWGALSMHALARKRYAVVLWENGACDDTETADAWIVQAKPGHSKIVSGYSNTEGYSADFGGVSVLQAGKQVSFFFPDDGDNGGGGLAPSEYDRFDSVTRKRIAGFPNTQKHLASWIVPGHLEVRELDSGDWVAFNSSDACKPGTKPSGSYDIEYALPPRGAGCALKLLAKGSVPLSKVRK